MGITAFSQFQALRKFQLYEVAFCIFPIKLKIGFFRKFLIYVIQYKYIHFPKVVQDNYTPKYIYIHYAYSNTLEVNQLLHYLIGLIYQCHTLIFLATEAENTVGHEGINAFILTSKSEHLTVKTASPPDPPRNLGVIATTCNSLLVAWDPPEEHGVEVIGKTYISLIDIGGCCLYISIGLIEGLRPQDLYVHES